MNKELLLALLGSLAVGGCATNQNSTLTPEELIDNLLADLAKKPIPENLAPGALCYSGPIFSLREHIDYHCPVCGGKTFLAPAGRFQYGMEGYDAFAKREEYQYDLIAEIQKLGLDAKIDERSFCEHCRAGMDPAPKIGDAYLSVTLTNQSLV